MLHSFVSPLKFGIHSPSFIHVRVIIVLVPVVLFSAGQLIVIFVPIGARSLLSETVISGSKTGGYSQETAILS